MSYIFLDESGDLGFKLSKKKTSQFFIITLLFVSNKRSAEDSVKKIFKSFTPKVRKYHHGALHAFRENPKTRQKLLRLLADKDISVVTLYLNKKKVYTKLHDAIHVLYSYVTNIVLATEYAQKN